MDFTPEFRCEVCGLVAVNPSRWFVIRCGDSELTVHRWDSEAAKAAGARHYCGEAHAEVYMSRWFESVRPRQSLVTSAFDKEKSKKPLARRNA